MILSFIIANILLIAILLISIGFIIGALTRMPVLFILPASSWMIWLKFLKNISDKSLMMYYLAAGLIFIITAIALAIKINR